MPAKMTVTCSLCVGSGTVPHVKRMTGPEDARIVDPMDLKLIDLCERCGGGGKMAAPPPPSTG